MANNKKTAPKKETKKAPKAPQNPPVDVEEAKVEQVAAQVINPEILASSKTSGLDANHQVELLGLMSKHFTGPVAAEKYGTAVEAKMDRIVAVGIVAAIAEHAVTGDSVFAGIMKKDAYPMLVTVAKEIGITLPDIKALPAGKEEGTVAIPTDAVVVDAEVAEQLANEKTTEESGDKDEIELDPKKVAQMGEEALKKALDYYFITGPKRAKFTVRDTIVNITTFMMKYRLAQAELAENTSELKQRYADYTTYDWLKDICQFTKPTFIVAGIGKGLINLVNIEKSPLSAFLILRESLIDKETKKVAWDDQSIADATRFFIEFICNDEIAKAQNAIDNLDKKSKDYKLLSENHQKVIDRHNAILDAITNISFDICEKIATEEGDAEDVTRKIAARIAIQYNPKYDINVPRSGYIGLEGNIRQRAGIILNLFVPSTEYNKNYSESNLVEIKEMPLEEWQKLYDEKKKAAAEKKQKESKNA